MTASRTDRVIAETVSSVGDSGTAPSIGTSRAVLLKPTRPCSAAGMRIEPPVSEPSAAQAAPAATEAAPPEVEPPGMRGVGSRPSVAGLASDREVRIEADAGEGELGHVGSADRRRAGAAQSGDGGASATAGGASRRIAEPAPVVSPATSNRSLIETARPASGPGSRPAPIARSAAAAAARAAAKRSGDERRLGARRLGGVDRALDQFVRRRRRARRVAGALRSGRRPSRML